MGQRGDTGQGRVGILANFPKERQVLRRCLRCRQFSSNDIVYEIVSLVAQLGRFHPTALAQWAQER